MTQERYYHNFKAGLDAKYKKPDIKIEYIPSGYEDYSTFISNLIKIIISYIYPIFITKIASPYFDKIKSTNQHFNETFEIEKCNLLLTRCIHAIIVSFFSKNQITALINELIFSEIENLHLSEEYTLQFMCKNLIIESKKNKYGLTKKDIRQASGIIVREINENISDYIRIASSKINNKKKCNKIITINSPTIKKSDNQIVDLNENSINTEINGLILLAKQYPDRIDSILKRLHKKYKRKIGYNEAVSTILGMDNTHADTQTVA